MPGIILPLSTPLVLPAVTPIAGARSAALAPLLRLAGAAKTIEAIMTRSDIARKHIVRVKTKSESTKIILCQERLYIHRVGLMRSNRFCVSTSARYGKHELWNELFYFIARLNSSRLNSICVYIAVIRSIQFGDL